MQIFLPIVDSNLSDDRLTSRPLFPVHCCFALEGCPEPRARSPVTYTRGELCDLRDTFCVTDIFFCILCASDNKQLIYTRRFVSFASAWWASFFRSLDLCVTLMGQIRKSSTRSTENSDFIRFVALESTEGTRGRDARCLCNSGPQSNSSRSSLYRSAQLRDGAAHPHLRNALTD